MAQSHKHLKGRRRKRWYRQKDSLGAAPGTLTLPPDARPTAITLFAYNGDRCIEERCERVEQVREFLGKYPVTWINVDGLGDVHVIRELGNLFHLHPLALEDVVHTHQRPKVEQYGDTLFIVMRMVQRREQLESEQVSIFVGRNYVLTFQENLPGDSFGPVRERLRTGGPLTSLGPDYLAYRLLDAIIDAYFPVLEQYGEQLETLEEEVLEAARRDTLVRVHEIRHDLLTLRRSVWPMREAFNSLVRDPNPLIHSDTRLFLRDCYDHTVQLMDFLETYRELGADLRDLHLSAASNRLAEIMKVLTIMSAIFIPLTFIAGLYGMNFEYKTPDGQTNPLNMPELRWYWGYPATLALMLLIAIAMVVFFYRRGWLGQPRPPAKKSGEEK
jgi:magnesium transporter